MSLKPFFCFYGGKWRAAKHYTRPLYQHIIEPFAGAAGYATRCPHLRVTLYDLDPAIYGVWDYLINVPASEIRRLPVQIKHVDEVQACQEARWLIGYWLNKASVSPCLTPSKWMRIGIRPKSHWGEEIRERIASQVSKIRHWRIYNRSYEQAGCHEATWFVDPPYSSASGSLYRFSLINFQHLASWCQKRRGQVIVCEQEGADWLPFQKFRRLKTTEGARGKSTSNEVVWEKS